MVRVRQVGMSLLSDDPGNGGVSASPHDSSGLNPLAAYQDAKKSALSGPFGDRCPGFMARIVIMVDPPIRTLLGWGERDRIRHHGVTTKPWNGCFGSDSVDAPKPPIR